jgi:toxin ParE1/3/4
VRLRYTAPALADLDQVIGYIETKTPQGCRRVQQRIQAFIEVIARHPHVGRQTDDPAIRRMATTPYPYLIFYEVTDEDVIIHAIRHSARNPSSMPDAV